jgi:benzoate/toluate 1,2-dioxygenase reductase subunit
MGSTVVHSARLIFQDGAELAVPLESGQTLLEGALGLNAPLRYDCCSGSCGSCVVRCLTGETRVDMANRLPVSAEELATGFRPACLTRLMSDATFELPYPGRTPPSEPSKHTAHIVQLRRAAPSVVVLTLKLQHPEDFLFHSGQYVRLAAPGAGEARAYSIASTQADLPLLDLMIRLVADGKTSHWLQHIAKIGDRVKLQAPLGAFAVDERARRHVFVAGGTGLAPVLSMIRSLRGRSQTALLCFGCTRRDELFYEDELKALATEMPELDVRVAVMEGASGDVRTGTAVSLLQQQDFDANAACYLCGPPPMVNAARKALMGYGIAVSAIRAERFQPGG